MSDINRNSLEALAPTTVSHSSNVSGSRLVLSLRSKPHCCSRDLANWKKSNGFQTPHRQNYSRSLVPHQSLRKGTTHSGNHGRVEYIYICKRSRHLFDLFLGNKCSFLIAYTAKRYRRWLLFPSTLTTRALVFRNVPISVEKTGGFASFRSRKQSSKRIRTASRRRRRP